MLEGRDSEIYVCCSKFKLDQGTLFMNLFSFKDFLSDFFYEETFFFKNFWIVMTFKVQVCKILTALVTVESKDILLYKWMGLLSLLTVVCRDFPALTL